MCGIFGVIRPEGIDEGNLEKFNLLSRALEHRGPDGSGFITEPTALIGMHRLSIMDLEYGAQPFSDERGRFTAIENGEIYNAAELRAQLKARGHRFTSGSDAEVVPHLFEEWGMEGFKRLRGMYSIALVDRLKAVVYLVRDRMGEKPLYVHRAGDSIWFSSELRALLKSGCIAPSLETQSVAEYLLHGFVPEELSFCGAEKVEPGSVLIISLADGSSSVYRYWKPWMHIGDEDLKTCDLASSIEDAVSIACTSDVPIGVALSGGLDSGLVAAIAARKAPNLQSFTIGYDTPTSYDETRAASEHARVLGIDHNLVTISTVDVGRNYGAVTVSRDEPIADIAGPSYLALASAFRAAQVPVLLSGQGGDELFWGYPWVRNAGLMSLNKRAPIFDTTKNYLRSMLNSKGEFVEGVRSLGGTRTYRRLCRAEEYRDFGFKKIPLFPLSPGYANLHRRVQNLMLSRYFEEPGVELPKDTQGHEALMIGIMQTYLRTNGLTQLDRLSMSRSIEARTPLVDYKLVEFVLGHQGKEGISLRDGKDVLRRAARLLAPELPAVTRKQGFTPPIRVWLSEIWKHERGSFGELALASAGIFDHRQLRKRIDQPMTKLGEVDSLAFRLLTLELWWRDVSP